VVQGEIADFLVEGEVAIGHGVLAHDRRRDGPVVIEVHLQCQTRTGGVDVVVIVFGAAGADELGRGGAVAVGQHAAPAGRDVVAGSAGVPPSSIRIGNWRSPGLLSM
jgi:hypothetical protein